jgi:phosphate-selective porin OprO/OprP
MNFNKKLAVAVSGAVLLMAGQFALADSATDIVDALVSKGVLTEEEGKLITKGHTSKTSVTPVVKEKDGAFILESANARNSIQLTGRMHLDYRHNNLDLYSTDFNDRDSASVADAWELRRARIGVKGVLAKDFKYEIVGNLPGTATVDVAYLDFAKYKEMQIRMGKFKQPFNLEELTSSNNIDFMERSYVNQLAPAKKIGAMIFGEPKDGFTYALSTYSMNDTELDSKNDKASFAGRSTLNFAQLMGNKEAVMHVGLAGFDAEYNVTPTTSSGSAAAESRANILAFRTPGRGLSSIFRAQIGGDLINNAATSTSTSTSTTTGGATTTTTTSTTTTATQQGAISNSTSQVKSNALGLEGAIALKNFKLQGEYTRANYSGSYNNRAEALDMDVKAMYGEVMWLVTGEKYADAYKAGTFGAIKPMSNFDLDTNQWGAWEVGFRMEKFDVSDIAATLASTTNGTRVQGTATCTTTSTTATSSSSNINGCTSKSTTYTAGVKWILNPNLMVKFNYSRTNFGNEWEYYDLNDSQRLNKENIYMMRTQYAF